MRSVQTYSPTSCESGLENISCLLSDFVIPFLSEPHKANNRPNQLGAIIQVQSLLAAAEIAAIDVHSPAARYHLPPLSRPCSSSGKSQPGDDCSSDIVWRLLNHVAPATLLAAAQLTGYCHAAQRLLEAESTFCTCLKGQPQHLIQQGLCCQHALMAP